MYQQNIMIALLLTTAAGLSTGIGSAIAYFIRNPRTIFLSFSLGLSAGVMIYVSFMELLPSAVHEIGEPWAVLTFFGGIALIGVIDRAIPEAENPHEYKGPAEIPGLGEGHVSNQLMRTGVLTALAIGIHNFPEGLATFGMALSNTNVGVIVAVAVAIHNIPEGISVSVPIFYATQSRQKAALYSFFSGLAEPVGAAVGLVVLLPFLSPGLLASLLALVGGIMVYISVDELLPLAHQYGHGHLVIQGIVLGMGIMAVSLLLL
ncbi:MAG: zinc transporter ZupT [Theionarchaea archaeon]|nr:zinc transporter ZupT [Theionarchaea archaeon]MBU7038720.1 zinc transporter ZupT [Theionarchaea archaeon]